MIRWQHLFSKMILSRGKEYFHNNAVKDLRRWAGTYRATVAGREKYAVQIVTAANKVLSMSCTCPYAEGGENCKHMAAVLYELEEETDEELNDMLNNEDATGLWDSWETHKVFSELAENVKGPKNAKDEMPIVNAPQP